MELSRGRTEQEAAPTRAASCRFSAPRMRGQTAGRRLLEPLQTLLWQSYRGRRWLGRQRAHATQQHTHVKAPDSRRHTSARSSAQPRGLKVHAQRPHQIGHEIKCYIKSALIPDPFNPGVAALRDPNKNSNCVHSSVLRACVCAWRCEAEAPRPTTLPPFPPYLRSPALQMKAQSSRSTLCTG